MLTANVRRHLGLDITATPAYLQSVKATANICACMATDTQYDKRTGHLHPSPSLSATQYNPAAYLEMAGSS